ncbi:threonine synthase [Paenibacillus beijingensis]|uniref:Pyridoxal-5'-phosphate-dependent protein subunit beta n=1 Tax=Paenibacillus beijingensis TaxID=1126833 RepID=A0A0D5NLJ4_9BACL|nr:threonine synthase [Paenibacillus beijingensis]AJY75877.1 pyridoxal-5'-phosphate-dependent protein subunit beta [Paenibacillus beijingensis]
MKYICNLCKRTYAPDKTLWRCKCGGLFDLVDFDIRFDLEKIQSRSKDIWRYREALPFAQQFDGSSSVSLGEGGTPMVALSPDLPDIFVKLDFLMPTLSFKDRGAAVLITKAQELGAKFIVADSSGNAGTSIAAYANRAGMECEIYVPDRTSSKKIKQISAHGAKVCPVPGSREDTAKAAQEAVRKKEAFYASHVYNPFFYQGTKTYAYEIWEQLRKAPDVVVVPVGNGTLLLGAYYGFKELLEWGLINKMPRLLAVQAEGCAPIARAFDAMKDEAHPVVNTGTAAEGIAIADPPRSRQILAAVRETRGVVVTAPEAAIPDARITLAKKGFYVEPTTAATYAGFVEYVRKCTSGKLPVDQNLFPSNPFELNHHGTTVVIPLCGAGLKAD